MKSFFTTLLILLLSSLPFTLIFLGCEKEQISQEIKKEKVSGFVQKGPYINGTQILMSELNASLEQTGKLFTSQIINDRGSFVINNIELTSSFVEFSASGFYFDEVKGELSSAPLTLFALADITDQSTVNVNILTHLERRRVEYLVNQGTGFSNAKNTAQAEVLAIFGIEKDNMQESENLDISVNSEDNAILLAISLILQGNRSVADLTELLATISSTIRDDGVFDNDGVMESLRASSLQLDLSEIRQNLEERYIALGIEATIPDFEDYITAFLSYTSGEPFASTQNAIEITTTGATLLGFVNPNSALTQVIFEYGLTTEYGTTATADQSPFEGNMGTPVQVSIGSLSPATTYHFRIKAMNEHGEFIGQDRYFTTLGEASDAETTPATNITLTSATLNGLVNPNHLSTTVIFEYGTTTNLGSEIIANQSPVSGDSELSVSADLEGLQPGTTYYYRVKSENELGISYANIAEFRTLGSKPAAIADYADALENTASLHGKVNPNLLNTTVTFEWGTEGSFQYSATAMESPIIGDNDISVSAEISGLQANTEYQFRIKAENELGVTLSQKRIFRTFNSTITDIDGNVYPTVIIGEQEWMAKNLKTTRYNDGSNIITGVSIEDWAPFSEGAYAIYPYELTQSILSEEEMIEIFGLLYNRFAVLDERGLCPSGWHVPENHQWTELMNYLGGPQIAGRKLKQAGTDYWIDNEGTNESGFSALPGGKRVGGYVSFGQYGFFWSSTEQSWTHLYYLTIHTGDEASNGSSDEHYGLSVRCIKD
jgi:uncharacterized protein (TIGR02145 family)